MSKGSNLEINFNELALSGPVLKALADVGYETPTPIQAQIIPHVLEGRDVMGQAQTGTGKTAAFALPLLSRIDLNHPLPQVLVLTPTRELALQVSEAFQRYAAHIKGFHVLPIYGGQGYATQLRQLKRGVHVVVGTPGRIMDHMRRQTLVLDGLSCLVLDEADEMLKMGFIDDVEWILEQTPPTCQIALFSATLPPPIRRIAQKHLTEPAEIIIRMATATAETIRQRYWVVNGLRKLEALTRLLEVEPFDGMLIFVRTKTATLELAGKLEARGYAATALNGDIPQHQREKTVEQFKRKNFDILVATDVAARGLDLERISHVINYDIPYDTEAYVHRIGRTGRAGRSGEAILFVAPREKRLLRAIEQATRQKIDLMEMPSTTAINRTRITNFKQRITDTLIATDLSFFLNLVEEYQHENDVPATDIAAALAALLQGEQPLLITESKAKPLRKPLDGKGRTGGRRRSNNGGPEPGMERYRIEVGHVHGVKPGNIVGAIANEAGLDSEFIGRISIHDDFSLVDLPEHMPDDLFRLLKKVWVAGQALRISRYTETDAPPFYKVAGTGKKKKRKERSSKKGRKKKR